MSSRRESAPYPEHQPFPVVGVEEDDGEVHDLPGLDERQRLEELVQRSESPRKMTNPSAAFTNIVFRVEVAEGEVDVQIGFECCSCGSSMLKPTESPPPRGRPVCGLHDPGASARDHGEALLGEAPAHLHRGGVVGGVLGDSGGAEDVTAGLASSETASNPSKNSSAMRPTCVRSAPSSLWRSAGRPSSEGALDVCRGHRHGEEHGEADVHGAGREPVRRRHLVVLRGRGIVALAPAP